MTLPEASVQLYSLRDAFAADPQGSLDKLAAIGYRNVEAFDFVGRPAEIRAALDASGLASPTGHAPLLTNELWTPDGSIPTPAPEVVFEAAATIGMTTVIDPFVAPERWLTEEGVADIAERLNALVETAAHFGLFVGYHNHAQEFIASWDDVSAYSGSSRSPTRACSSSSTCSGRSPAARTFRARRPRLGDRLAAVHVKDGVVPAVNPWAPEAAALGGSSELDQRRPGEGDVALAQGAGAGTAIRYAVVEYDNAPGDVFEDVAASLAFLKDGGFVA